MAQQERLAHYSEVVTIGQADELVAVGLAIIVATSRLAMVIMFNGVLASMAGPWAVATADTEVMVIRMAITVAQVLNPKDFLMSEQPVQKVLEVVQAFEAAVAGRAAELPESCSLQQGTDRWHQSR